MALQTLAKQWLDMYGVNTVLGRPVGTPTGKISPLQMPADSVAHAAPVDSLLQAVDHGAVPAVADTVAVVGHPAADMTQLGPSMFPDIAAGAPQTMDTTAVAVVDTLTVTAREMFGEASYIPQVHTGQVLSECVASFLTDSLVFKLVVLVCFVAYCLILYMYRQQAHSLVNVFRSKLYVDNLLGERNYTFDHFLNSVVMLGILSSSLAGIKVADMLAGANMALSLPPWAVLLLAPAAWLLLGAVFLYQVVVLKIAGALTDSQKFSSLLRFMRKINFSVSAVLLTPFFLMFSMALNHDAHIISTIIIAVLVIVVIFHLARTYMLFVDEKISKLYWFLYLCGVEIFPVTFLLLSVRKFLL